MPTTAGELLVYEAFYCRCKGLTAHAHVCSRMLTYAHVCSRMLTYAHVCSRMLTYAHVCCRCSDFIRRHIFPGAHLPSNPHFTCFPSTKVQKLTHWSRWTPALYALLVQKRALLALLVQKYDGASHFFFSTGGHLPSMGAMLHATSKTALVLYY
jgi:hypothetical protein